MTNQSMKPIIIRDLRQKEKFVVDDAYLNGYAKHFGTSTTAVYLSLCRHAGKNQSSFPSLAKIAEEHSISPKTVQRAIKKLEEYNLIHKEKTRGKKGKWLNNTYFLQDKRVWKPIGHQRPMDNPEDISAQAIGHQRPTKETHKKETHNNIIYSNDLVVAVENENNETTTTNGKTINALISLFEKINPTSYLLYKNKTQRKSIENLVNKYGEDRIRKLLEELPQIISKPYAPRITTPYQLEQKFGELLIFLQQDKRKGGVVDARKLD